MLVHILKRWIKGFLCSGCGSTLGKWQFNKETGRVEKLCFVCCAGEFELKEMEIDGEDFEQILRLSGRESGPVEKILPRLNTPSAVLSTHQTNPLMDYSDIKDGMSCQLATPAFSGLTRSQVITIEKLLNSRKKSLL